MSKIESVVDWNIYDFENNKDCLYVFPDSEDKSYLLDWCRKHDNAIGFPTRKTLFYKGNDFYTNGDEFIKHRKIIDEYMDKIFDKFVNGNYRCIRVKCMEIDPGFVPCWGEGSRSRDYIRESLCKLESRLNDKIFMDMFFKVKQLESTINNKDGKVQYLLSSVEQLESMITDKNKQIDNLLSRIDALETSIDKLKNNNILYCDY